ncbi:type II toxin-antitoxin system death-on-curing family toxin [Candidatus Beckwithbacteria bacterium]|nr:type II toxin-antitoxin system death-on-curing family toxin [Candidatus Beckwithbacteria bacterium]
MTFGEPIPDFCTRNNELLESSLAAPRQTFSGKLLHPTLVDQVVALFYSLIKNHPFENGNKRIAVMAILVFLHGNNKWISIKPSSLYEMAIFVSQSKPNEKDTVYSRVKNKMKPFIINRDK